MINRYKGQKVIKRFATKVIEKNLETQSNQIEKYGHIPQVQTCATAPNFRPVIKQDNIINTMPTTPLAIQPPYIWSEEQKTRSDVPNITIKGPEITDNNPRIAITSIVRDEERDNSLIRFLECCQELESYHKNIVYIFIEGDSSDRTYDILKSWVEKRNGSVLEKIDRGYPPFQSNRDSRRTVYFAELRNRLIKLILSMPMITEVLMIDANYGWKGDLINILRETDADIVAPLVVSHKNNDGKYSFYDIWAFRKNNKEFSWLYPYAEDMIFDRSIEIDSVGGGYLVKRNVFESGIIYKGDTDSEHVSFCNQAKNMNFKIKINPKIYIRKGGFKE